MRARFILEAGDLEAIGDIQYDGQPNALILGKTAGGVLAPRLDPDIRRPAAPFLAALDAMKMIQDLPELEEETKGQLQDLAERAEVILTEHRELAPGRPDLAVLRDLAARFRTLGRPDAFVESGDESPLLSAAEAISTAIDLLSVEHPGQVAAARLAGLAPRFLVFEDTNRALASFYDLGDEPTRKNPPVALRNLLSLAGVSVDDLWADIAAKDVSRLRTKLKRANASLLEHVRPAWRQTRIALRIEVDSTILHVLVDELREDGERVSFGERSDGLKTFLALLCFLKVQGHDRAQILLVDEAEMHLHYDAQADLVDVFSGSLPVSQVIYTTHSPGCLPADLGTGVRFVAPDPGKPEVSHLRNDFWSSGSAGFSSLLFAMGAGILRLSEGCAWGRPE